MSFRTVVISKQSLISYKNRFLVVKQGIDEKYIHLSEIDTIIIDSISVSLTTYLLKELSNNKINIIFCDEKHQPFGELKSFYTSHNSSKKIINQSKWKTKNKNILWKEIIKNKIMNQALMLKKINSDNYDKLLSYTLDVSVGDSSNKEGHAAKVYFNSMFGMDFVRHNDDQINSALNYGYTVLLSTFSKEIISLGYITQLGIHHKNEFNPFNLSCDLMEPFRVIIDNFVYYNKTRKFNKEYKMDLINLFNQKYNYKNKQYILKDIIKMYVKNIFDTIEENKPYIGFSIYEK